MSYIFSPADWDHVDRLVAKGCSREEAINLVDDDLTDMAHDAEMDARAEQEELEDSQ